MVLYVTDWAPSGTNDLLVCDEDHQIVHAIEAATFGIDVMKHRSPMNDLVADDVGVFSVPRLEAQEQLPSEFTFVRQITLQELRQRMCVSPIDPDGAELLKRLRDAGVVL